MKRATYISLAILITGLTWGIFKFISFEYAYTPVESETESNEIDLVKPLYLSKVNSEKTADIELK